MGYVQLVAFEWFSLRKEISLTNFKRNIQEKVKQAIQFEVN